jgi:hypothetical protein
VADEKELDDFFNKLKEAGIPCCAWYEEDFCNALTAIATAPLVGDKRRPFRRLPLLK